MTKNRRFAEKYSWNPGIFFSLDNRNECSYHKAKQRLYAGGMRMRRLFEKIKEHLLHRFRRNPESITKQQQKHPTYNGYEDSPLRVLDSIHFMFRYIALLCGVYWACCT